MRGTLISIAIVLVAACTGGSSADQGSNTVAPEPDTGTAPAPSPTTSSTIVPDDPIAPGAVVPDGYELVQATVTAPDGSVCELCLWLAETADQRSRGLMFVTDLGAADGMAFVYPAPHSGSFWMKNTVLALSIAFFDGEGEYIEAFDMEPCTAEPCPLYSTPADFLVAVEVERGSLPDVDMVPGSVLRLTDLPCP